MFNYHNPIYVLPQDFQTQWEVIVSLLYQAVVREALPTCPSVQLIVVGKEEGSLCASNSSLGKDAAHIHVSWYNYCKINNNIMVFFSYY